MTEVFSIKDKNSLRKKMNLPTNKKIILFLSQSLENKRKGFHFLLDALNLLQKKDILLIAIGNKPNKLPEKFLFDIIFTGHIDNEIILSEYYNVSDLFINPAICDNLPNTVAEATCCGVPTIAFAVCGEVEMIKNEITGFLIENISSFALSEGIKKALNFKFDRQKIRDYGVSKYSSDVIVSKYENIYRSFTK